MGIKTQLFFDSPGSQRSEKPPHHMGIKTSTRLTIGGKISPLKNLPTTWGLRRQLP